MILLPPTLDDYKEDGLDEVEFLEWKWGLLNTFIKTKNIIKIDIRKLKFVNKLIYIRWDNAVPMNKCKI